MEIILLNDIAKVGRRFEVVHVSEGYAINFLIPKGFARAATPSAIKDLENKKAYNGKDTEASQAKIAQDLKQIDGKTVILKEKTNEQGHLFASIHPEKIASAIYDQLGVCLPVTMIEMQDSIKQTGDITFPLSKGGTSATITLSVVSAEHKK